MSDHISYVAGTVASDPEQKPTSKGTVTSFRLAVTAARPNPGEKYGETAWYEVVTKHEGIAASILRDVYKGAKVVVQGLAVTKEYNDKLQYSIWVDRIGLVEWLRREQVPQQVAPEASELGF